MNRRSFLALGAAGAGFVAGCAGSGQRSTRSTTDRTTDEPPTATGAETTTTGATTTADPGSIHVAPDGSDSNPGTSGAPMATIQAAVGRAKPGDTVRVAPGTYREGIRTVRDGRPGEPITITGPREAVIRPESDRPLLAIRHNHVHLTGLTLNGLADQTRADDPSAYTGPLLWATPRPGDDDYLTDLKLTPRAVGNSLNAMLQLIRTNHVEIGAFEVIGPGGIQHLLGDAPGHVGEVIYLGTAPGNVQHDWYPWESLDESHDVHVHHVANREGHPHAELVDVKPGCYDVTIEYCSDLGGAARYLLDGHDETSETAIHLGGSDCVLRWTEIEGSQGQAVEVASWDVAHPDKFERYKGFPPPDGLAETGLNNAIYGNRFVDNGGLAIQYPTVDGEIAAGYGPDAQGTICGNEYTGETHGDPGVACADSIPTGDGLGYTGGDGPGYTGGDGPRS